MRAKPYLENMFSKFSYVKYRETSEAYTEFANDFFQRIKSQNYLQYGQMLKLFGKLQTITIVIIISRTEDISDLNVGLELKRQLLGKNLFEEIITELEKMKHPFYNWLRRKISTTKTHKQEIRCLKKEIRDIEGTTHLFLHDMRQFLLQIKGMMEENVLTEEIEIQKVLKMILLGLKKELYLDLQGEIHP